MIDKIATGELPGDMGRAIASSPSSPHAVLETFAGRVDDRRHSFDDESLHARIASNPNVTGRALQLMVTTELNDRKSKARQVSEPSELPWFTKRVEKAAAEVQAAVAQDDFLNYAGKSANRAVLSTEPNQYCFGTLLKRSDRTLSHCQSLRVDGVVGPSGSSEKSSHPKKYQKQVSARPAPAGASSCAPGCRDAGAAFASAAQPA